MNLEICRVCLSAVDVLFNVHDPLDKDQTMYTVLCRIFPEAFGDETDLNEWPSKLCKKCKRKVLNTHSFYNLCMASHIWWNEQFAEVSAVCETSAECSIGLVQEVSPHAEPSPCLLPQSAESLNFDAPMYEDWASELEPEETETQEEIIPVGTIDEILVYEEDTSGSGKENTQANTALAESLPHLCTFCEEVSFASVDALTNHLLELHRESVQHCEPCSVLFLDRKKYQVHQKSHDLGHTFFCGTFTAAHHLKRHMVVHTGERSYKCGFCGKQFAQGSVLVKHTRTHIGENVFPCVHCDASFPLLRDLRNHYKEHPQSGDGTITDSSVAGDGLGPLIRFNTKDALNIRYRKDGINITN
ncbi:zinc finger protein 84-like [Anopheles cruzii]|uniref:zinc finger protein 84-like n=1 Tax=Anopheles cruzii TaxID=68878 RepID=UPI0022EC7F68|nr:zinc finger protein 84-like [Anopheles cruzii]